MERLCCGTGLSYPAGALEQMLSISVAPLWVEGWTSYLCLTQAQDAHCPSVVVNFVSTRLGHRVPRWLVLVVSGGGGVFLYEISL